MVPVKSKLTPVNFTEGRGGNRPEFVVFHWWGAPSQYRQPDAHDAVVRYFHRAAPDGTQLRDEDGNPLGSSANHVDSYRERTEVVDDEDTAWHAGNWEANQKGLGEELMPFDHDTPAEQVRGTFVAGAETCAVWLHRYPWLTYTVHNKVSNKATACPGRWELVVDKLWAHAKRLVPFVEPGGTIAAGAPQYEGTVFMRNPMIGGTPRGGQLYGPRDFAASPFHAGIDIPATSGTAVAAFAGRVTHVVADRKPGQPSTQGTVLAPGRSANGVRIKNPDGEGQLYAHIRPIVTEGQWVAEGQIIGYLENPPSGIATGPHLHFETWRDANNPSSHFDPMILFRKYGITPGVGGAASAGAQAVQNALLATIDPRTGKPFYGGIPDGVVGPMHIAAVKEWQEFRGLVADGDWGSLTQADYTEKWKPHVHTIWDKLTRLGYKVGADDRMFGPMLYAGVIQFQKDEDLVPDGIWGSFTDAAADAALAESEPAPVPPPAPEPSPTPAPDPDPPAPEPSPEPGPELVTVDAVIAELIARLSRKD